MRRPRRPRGLTAGEARLWGEIARLVTPLRARAALKAGPAGEGAAAPAAATDRAPAPDAPPPALLALEAPLAASPPFAPPPAKKPARRPSPTSPAPDPARPPTAASYQAPPQRPAPSAGLERQARLGLRRGKLRVEARIDLHGMIQAEAHAALTGFVLRSVAAGHGYVLVVTGKGGVDKGGFDGGGFGYGGAFAERGVLRRSVPHWLRGPELAGLVIGFEEAARHHGGAGALYVRLRRR